MLQKVELKKRCIIGQNLAAIEVEALRTFSQFRKDWDEEFENWNKKCQKMHKKSKKLAARRAKGPRNSWKPEMKMENGDQRSIKKRKQESEIVNPVSLLPPPPSSPPDTMLFCENPNLEEIFKDEDAICAPPFPTLRESKARFGRGGRLVFDR